MAVFTVPLDNQTPPADQSAGSVSPVALDFRDLPDPLSNRLFRWYSSRRRGRNVFILKDGTVTEVVPAATYDVNGKLISAGWDLVADDPNTSGSGPGNLNKQVFYGGHGPYTINATQVTQLTTAGYGAYIT